MNEFETSKREEYRIEELSNPTFTDLDGKWKALEEIQKARAGLMDELRTNDSAKERQSLHDIIYDLKGAKHAVEAHMVKIVRNRRG